MAELQHDGGAQIGLRRTEKTAATEQKIGNGLQAVNIVKGLVGNKTEEGLQTLLAHEITHNWPSLSRARAPVRRNNQISTEVFLSAMNATLNGYYLRSIMNISDEVELLKMLNKYLGEDGLIE
ncbi:hypothetical protein QQX98_012094 [Neonectria punicea]|uniref:Peptidase M48 domain-containing protein n=1 Tax=Neonectria punicea TaxID=979145 RepID=A0ABR1GJS4_9HYPO